MEQLSAELIDAIQFVKSVAPEVWATYVRQQYIEAICWIAATCCIGLLTIPLRKLYENADDCEEETLFGTAHVIAWIMFAVFALITVTMAVPTLLNPEYYALKELLP